MAHPLSPIACPFCQLFQVSRSPGHYVALKLVIGARIVSDSRHLV